MGQVERYIARRYLTSKQSMRFINVISLISIVGITVGVAALLIALSVFNGFNGVVTSVLVGFDPHVRIERRGGLTGGDVNAIAGGLHPLPPIKSFAPLVSCH